MKAMTTFFRRLGAPLAAALLAVSLFACTPIESRPVSEPSSMGSSAPESSPSRVTSSADADSGDSSAASDAASADDAPVSSLDTVTSLPDASSETSSAGTVSSAPEPNTLSSILEGVSSANEEAKQPPASSSEPPVSSAPPVSSEPPASSEPETPSDPGVGTPSEMKAVWLSYLEFQAFAGSSESVFTDKLCTMLDTIVAKGLNTVIVQVRPYGDSFYPSEYYPWSKCISGTFDVDPGYDPLEIIVWEAHARGLSVHAWINPYRTMTDKEFASVSDSWPIKQWYNSADRSRYMLQMGDGRWWLQPGNAEVQQLIENGANEILTNYAVDGLHMDDYFYNVDPAQYGDSKSQAQANTTALVQSLYSITKAHGADKLFGISPMGAFREDASLPTSDTGAHSTDLQLWCSQPGYLDYVMPQIYWEYDHATQPFTMTLEKWENFVTEDSVALYIGLAPYRLSAQEVEQQIADVEASLWASGYCLFRYDHIHGLDLS